MSNDCHSRLFPRFLIVLLSPEHFFLYGRSEISKTYIFVECLELGAEPGYRLVNNGDTILILVL